MPGTQNQAKTYHNSVEVNHNDLPSDHGKPRRSYLLSAKEELPVNPHATVNTLYDILLYCSREFPADKKFLGSRTLLRIVKESKEIKKNVGGVETKETKTWSYNELSPYRWETYLDLYKNATQIGAGLIHLGMKPHDRLTIFHSTSKEWFTMAQACYTQSIVLTTAYDNLGDDALIYSLNEGEISTLFTQPDLLKVVTKIGDRAPTLKYVIYSGEISTAELNAIKEKCPQFQFFPTSQIQEMGRLNPHPATPPKPEDLACIMYTSGSTGNPKGVMLTHANVVAGVTSLKSGVFRYVDGPNETFLAYLPLAHILEFVVEHTCMLTGVAMGYGSPRTLSNSAVRNCNGDMCELKPSLMSGVPAIWETIRRGINAQLDKASPMEKYLFKQAFNLKKSLMRMGMPYDFVDKKVFKKIQQSTGGNLKVIVSGGAPIAVETQEFLSITLAQVIQGYGMTESTGTLAVQPIREKSVYGIVGAPFPTVELKLVASTGYNPNPTNDDTPPRGEVWARGANIMKGYFKQPGLTTETLTEDGWLMTGDIGEWREDGSLAIIDRKKNLVKLAHGEYVAIEKMESQYKTSKYVLNLVIHADPLRSHVAAVISINPPEIKKLANAIGIDESELNDKRLVAGVLKDLVHQAKNAEFKGAEIIKAISLTSDEWTAENEMLTAAQKLNRKAVIAKYSSEIESMYA